MLPVVFKMFRLLGTLPYLRIVYGRPLSIAPLSRTYFYSSFEMVEIVLPLAIGRMDKSLVSFKS